MLRQADFFKIMAVKKTVWEWPCESEHIVSKKTKTISISKTSPQMLYSIATNPNFKFLKKFDLYYDPKESYIHTFPQAVGNHQFMFLIG